jgi:NAD+ kinase
MRFAIISNNTKDPEGRYIRKVMQEAENAGGTISFSGSFGVENNLPDNWYENADFILAMGGDGTFLNIADRTSHLGIPILGINIGSMGFLAGIEVKDSSEAFKKLLEGNYSISKRMMVRADIFRLTEKVTEVVALNDIVISRGLLSRIVTIETHINNKFIDTFPGDGIIVSTPTGSTGYSLSAGGPVIDHTLELMLITPICPHIMHARSFVTGAESSIRLIVNEASDYKCTLTTDGQKGLELFGGDEILITKSKDVIKMAYIGENDLYDTLRNKIYYRKAGGV